MKSVEFIGCPRGADETEGIDVAARHERMHYIIVSKYDVYDAWWKGVTKQFEEKAVEQGSEARRFDDDGIAHEQSRHHEVECLVQREIVRPQAEGDPQRRLPDADVKVLRGQRLFPE